MELSLKRLLKLFNRSFGQNNEPEQDQTSYTRSFNRFPLEFEVAVSLIDSDGHRIRERSELHDVSGGGAMFISRMPEKYYPGQLLKLDIFLAGTQDVRACVKTEASVVRIHRIETDDEKESGLKTGVAVKFNKPFEFERIDRSFLLGNLT